VVAQVLADERDDIELLVRSLADLSGDGLDLVSEHAVRLRTDIEIVTRLVRSIDTNLDGVQDLIDGGRGVISGFLDSYNPRLNAIDLRNQFSPLVSEALQPVFDAIDVPFPCIPVDVACPDGPLGGLDGGGDAVPAALDRPQTPIDDILGLLGSPTAAAVAGSQPAPAEGTDDGPLARFLGTFLGVGS
jgi:hypothetical protein